MGRLKYDVVVATRNRPDALSLSLPMLLQQSRLPERVIVVDSSDDESVVKRVIDAVAVSTAIPFEFLRSEPGLTLQRNIGLDRVKSDVTFFSDDDSLVLPGALEAMMRIYEKDEQYCRGVCSAEATTAPEGVLNTARSTYEMSAAEKLKKRVGRYRYALERRYFLGPLLIHGRRRWQSFQSPKWLAEENAVLVEYLTGFRMSFRTSVIRGVRFHEPLKAYACSRTDASFGVLGSRLLVGARNAQIHHHKAPGHRSSGRVLGVTQILNRAYVLRRHAAQDSPAVRQLMPFCRYKIAQYLAGSRSRFARERLAGAVAAYRICPSSSQPMTHVLKKGRRPFVPTSAATSLTGPWVAVYVPSLWGGRGHPM